MGHRQTFYKKIQKNLHIAQYTRSLFIDNA